MNHSRAIMVFLTLIAASSISINAMESITITNQTYHDIYHLVVRFNVKVINQDKEETYLGFIMKERLQVGERATFDVDEALIVVGSQGTQDALRLISYLHNNSKNVQTVTLERIQSDRFLIPESAIPNAPALVIKGNDVLESSP